MTAVMGDTVTDGKPSTKTNAERVATSINALLNQLTAGGDCDVAIVGYKSRQGQVDVACRWDGALAGRDFVAARELANAPLRSESRTRRQVAADGSLREETVAVPVWYSPTLGEHAPQVAALTFCKELLSGWLAGAAPDHAAPLVIHLYAGAASDGNPAQAAAALMESGSSEARKTLLLQAQIAPAAALVTTQYPASLANLTLGPSRDLFARVSKLPQYMQDALKAAKVAVSANARGMLHNAKIADVIRLLSLVKTHIGTWSAGASGAAVAATDQKSLTAGAEGSTPHSSPQSQAATTQPGDSPPTSNNGGTSRTLVIFILDRSVDDQASTDNPCARLQQQANELLKQLSKLDAAPVDVGIISYGAAGNGQCDVRSTFEGPLSGKSFVPIEQLAGGPLRIDEREEQVSNGIGGLVSFMRKTPVYFDVAPTAATGPEQAFAEAGRTIAIWAEGHSAPGPPILLHMTHGPAEPVALEHSISALRSSGPIATSAVIYHLVLTDSPHKSLAYPDTDQEISDPKLQELWRITSNLELNASHRPGIQAGAKGFVVNGKFDAFLDCVKQLCGSN